jgi:hypothetical protein
VWVSSVLLYLRRAASRGSNEEIFDKWNAPRAT